MFCGFFWMLKSVKHKFFSNFKFSKNKSHSANKIKWIFRELIFTTDIYIDCCNEMKKSLHKTSTMHQKSFSCQHKKETKFVIRKKQEGKLSKWVLERRSDFLQKISIIKKKTWIHFQNNWILIKKLLRVQVLADRNHNHIVLTSRETDFLSELFKEGGFPIR